MPDTHVEVGQISPGNSPGILTIVGNLTTSAPATLNIEIDGPTVGTEYDKLVVQNKANIDGNINVVLGYLPPNDAVFEIVSAETLTTTNLPATIEAEFGGNVMVFSVETQENAIYLVGPGGTLHANTISNSEIISVYPNPTQNQITLKNSGNSPLISATVMDNHGRILKLINLDNMTEGKTISLENYADGNYFLKIKGMHGIITKQIVKQ